MTTKNAKRPYAKKNSKYWIGLKKKKAAKKRAEKKHHAEYGADFYHRPKKDLPAKQEFQAESNKAMLNVILNAVDYLSLADKAVVLERILGTNAPLDEKQLWAVQKIIN